ncbi:MAG: hypothetical protein CMO81_03835 [Waddliaceae bacterium]|nr:hypothetical protein [Waddliaceae bacterium]
MASLQEIRVQYFFISILYLVSMTLYSEPQDFSMKKAILIAHRGVSAEAPENTLAAFKRAVELDLPFIEMDIHLNKEGIPIVIHDETLSRTTNESKDLSVADASLDYLKQLDAGSWFHEKFSGETIPTLEQTLQLLWGKIGLMLELKSSEGQEAQLAKAVLTVLEKWMKKPSNKAVIIGSFSHKIVSRVRELNPEQAVIGITETDEAVHEYIQMGLKHIAISKKQAKDSLFDLLKKQNARTWVYTVDEVETAQELLEFGVEGIISNDPQKIKRSLKL